MYRFCVSANSRAKAISISSEPLAASSDKPTGSPSTSASGRLIWGMPVVPAMQVSVLMRGRKTSRVDNRSPRSGAGVGVVGRQTTTPSARTAVMRLMMACRETLAASTSASEMALAKR